METDLYPGEMILSLFGLVRIYYEPTGTLIAEFIFPDDDPIIPKIVFVQDIEAKTLMVVSVWPDDVLWNDLHIEHEGSFIGYTDDGDRSVDPGETIFSLYGLVRIYYEPTGTLLSEWEFPPMLPLTVYVDDDFNENTSGWGYDHFDKIQDGIDAVAEGGSVHVDYGTYTENIVIEKQLDLIGNDKNFVIVDGGNIDEVIQILANNVSVSGFTLHNSGAYAA